MRPESWPPKSRSYHALTVPAATSRYAQCPATDGPPLVADVELGRMVWVVAESREVGAGILHLDQVPSRRPRISRHIPEWRSLMPVPAGQIAGLAGQVAELEWVAQMALELDRRARGQMRVAHVAAS